MNAEMTVPLTLFAIMFTFWLIIERFFSPFILKYELTNEDIVFLLFSFIPLRKIKYNDILDIKVGGVLENLIIAVQSETHASKLLGPRVFIKRKQAWIPWIAITPDNPHDFVNELRTHLEQKK